MGLDGMGSLSGAQKSTGVDFSPTQNAEAEKTESKSKESIFTRNDRKAWIAEHKEEYGSKKAARKAFDEQFEEIDKMSRKEAKAWVKEKMAETGCSKKEAKAMFKQEFGYDVPMSRFTKMLRAAVLENPIGMLLFAADGISDGKVGIHKFITGEGNNDAAFVKKSFEVET